MSTRRELLKTVAAAATALPALGQHTHSTLVQVAAPYKPKVFNPENMKVVSVLVDAIIPRTDSPGASDAGVPAAIDQVLNKDQDQRQKFLAGLELLARSSDEQLHRPLASIGGEQMAELLAPWSQDLTSEGGRFFQLVKDLTIDSYYSTKEGLAGELGWHGNTYLSSFPGCTHPEHGAPAPSDGKG